MPDRKSLAAVALILAFAAGPALAAEDEHHPVGSPSAAAPSAPQGMPGMQGGMMGQGGMMAGMGAGAMPMMDMMRMMEGHAEGRIAFLKAELKITDAQLPLWNAVAETIRANAKSGMGMMGGMMGMAQGGKLPERLAAREKSLTGRLEALRKLKAAVDPLYAALSDEQKKAADEMLMSPMGMM